VAPQYSIARLRTNMPRDFWYLWQGQLVSQVGTQAFQVLALFWMASHTHNAGAGALFLALSLLPPVIAGPYLARWSTKFAPRTVMVACDLLAATLALPVLIAVLLDASVPVVLAMMLVSNTLLAMTHALMLPTVHAAIPTLVDGTSLKSANGWMQTTQQVSTVVGQALGGIAYALIGPAGLCLVNMTGFAMSGLLARRMTSPGVCQVGAGQPRGVAPWAMLKSQSGLRNLTIVSAVFNVLYAPWLVLLPFHLSATGSPSAGTMGLVLAAYGLGSLIGNLVLTRVIPGLASQTLWKALIGMALALLLLGQTNGALQTAMALLIMGAGIGWVNVQIMTKLQLSVAPELRAGAVAVMRSSVHLATPFGYGVVALAQHSLAWTPALIFTGCGLVLLGALISLRSLLRE